MALGDVDLFEINEAFAVVAEKYIRDLKLDRTKVNVNGGSIALGHPIAGTGAILIGTALDELDTEPDLVIVRVLARGHITAARAGSARETAGTRRLAQQRAREVQCERALADSARHRGE